ncbi:thiamine pyrophosphate-binding protein [Roseomonas gilardii]|uniref:thiamine pyrophosphate-binding protein n=1 Tax=Roseomonas gilardii TaxID=257708 RepID=UPI0004B0AE23|nr:thiamine pyrophosphate-binding protein [Roseomonas gilardii]
MGSEASAWQQDVFDVLKAAKIRHLAYVPDAGHATAIRMAEADETIHSVVLTTEEEGIGYLAGAWLGGERGALLMQSSGAGNCINTLSLVACARFPLLMVVRPCATTGPSSTSGRIRWDRPLRPRCG